LRTANCELFQDGTLNPPTSDEVPEVPTIATISFYDQEAIVEPCTTGNEIMAVIFNECEKYELELLDDGIYRDDLKLGEVGCTEGNWWVIRASSDQQKIACDSVAEAVQSLSVVNALSYEELLDMPFDQLNANEWRKLLEYGLVAA
jgi:hypothetical protein